MCAQVYAKPLLGQKSEVKSHQEAHCHLLLQLQGSNALSRLQRLLHTRYTHIQEHRRDTCNNQLVFFKTLFVFKVYPYWKNKTKQKQGCFPCYYKQSKSYENQDQSQAQRGTSVYTLMENLAAFMLWGSHCAGDKKVPRHQVPGASLLFISQHEQQWPWACPITSKQKTEKHDGISQNVTATIQNRTTTHPTPFLGNSLPQPSVLGEEEEEEPRPLGSWSSSEDKNLLRKLIPFQSPL